MRGKRIILTLLVIVVLAVSVLMLGCKSRQFGVSGFRVKAFNADSGLRNSAGTNDTAPDTVNTDKNNGELENLPAVTGVGIQDENNVTDVSDVLGGGAGGSSGGGSGGGVAITSSGQHPDLRLVPVAFGADGFRPESVSAERDETVLITFTVDPELSTSIDFMSIVWENTGPIRPGDSVTIKVTAYESFEFHSYSSSYPEHTGNFIVA